MPPDAVPQLRPLYVQVSALKHLALKTLQTYESRTLPQTGAVVLLLPSGLLSLLLCVAAGVHPQVIQ
jgi:hypothetical protein